MRNFALGHPRSRTKKLCKCVCGWRGYRVGDVSKKPCPRCGRMEVKRTTYNPISDEYLYIPTCSTCKFFKRNEGFPNRYGECLGSDYVSRTHDTFGCADWEYNAKQKSN